MPQRKLLYVDSLATSLLTVHSGAWEPLSRPQECSLIGAQVASYRSATGLLYKPDEDNCTNPEVFHKTHSLPVSVIVRVNRLRLFHVILRAKLPALHHLLDSLINADGAWPQAILSDSQWAMDILGCEAPQGADRTLESWVCVARQFSAESWKALLKVV